MDYSKIRGFNYRTGYGVTSMDEWMRFDADRIELELRRGKEYFPGMNAIRVWLSFDAYKINKKRFLENLEKELGIADSFGLKSVVCIFNRWKERHQDNGGVYLDHIIPAANHGGWLEEYADFTRDVVSGHIGDKRILIWDIRNEPFSYAVSPQSEIFIQYELEWLTNHYKLIKSIDEEATAGVSIHPHHGKEGLERIEPISDVLMIHPYYLDDVNDDAKKKEFLESLRMNRDFARGVKKPVLVTETCWGALDDRKRVALIKFTLQSLKEYELGFLAHALNYSVCPDLHDPEDGPVGEPGNLAFINKDGSLRAGHDIFNQY